jgi:hypothetical protein
VREEIVPRARRVCGHVLEPTLAFAAESRPAHNGRQSRSIERCIFDNRPEPDVSRALCRGLVNVKGTSVESARVLLRAGEDVATLSVLSRTLLRTEAAPPLRLGLLAGRFGHGLVVALKAPDLAQAPLVKFDCSLVRAVRVVWPTISSASLVAFCPHNLLIALQSLSYHAAAFFGARSCCTSS